jgi:predicted nucleic acid-binding protein
MKDTEDALQVACAIRHGADYFITRNTKHYKQAKGVTVLPPPALAALFNSSHD